MTQIKLRNWIHAVSLLAQSPRHEEMWRGGGGNGRKPPPRIDKDAYIQPSPPLVDDMYGELVPQVRQRTHLCHSMCNTLADLTKSPLTPRCARSARSAACSISQLPRGAVVQVFASLLGHIEQVGMGVEGLFAGDPSVRQLNDVIDLMHTSPDAPLANVTRGNPQVAAAALAAYTRQLPEALVPSPFYEQLGQAIEMEEYVNRIATVRDVVAEMPEANQAVLHRWGWWQG
mgnify:CR=1 FL=1